MTLQSSQRLPELLLYTKKSYKILQLQFQLQFQLQHYNPENSPSRIQFYIQKTKSSSSTTTTFQRVKRPSLQKRNSTHRRQGDLLEMHPCVYMTFQLLQLLQLRYSSYSRDIPDIPVIHDLPAFQAILQCSSILQLECIFYIFYNFYSSIGFHRKLHRVPVGQLQTLQTLHSSKKGRCCDIGQDVKMTYFLE